MKTPKIPTVKPVDMHEVRILQLCDVFVVKDYAHRERPPVKLHGGFDEARDIVLSGDKNDRRLVYGYNSDDEAAGRLVQTVLLTRTNLMIYDRLISEELI